MPNDEDQIRKLVDDWMAATSAQAASSRPRYKMKCEDGPVRLVVIGIAHLLDWFVTYSRNS